MRIVYHSKQCRAAPVSFIQYTCHFGHINRPMVHEEVLAISRAPTIANSSYVLCRERLADEPLQTDPVLEAIAEQT